MPATIMSEEASNNTEMLEREVHIKEKKSKKSKKDKVSSYLVNG